MDSLARIVQAGPFLASVDAQVEAINTFRIQEMPAESSQLLRYYNSKTGSQAVLSVVDQVKK